MEKTQLLELKKKMRKSRPKFLRQDYHHRMKVEDDLWRKPKGRHSKMRQRIHGHRAAVKIGYGSPAEVRGLHRSGAKFVHIRNMADLFSVKPEEHVVVLSSTIGGKKRYEILKAVRERNIKLVNVDASKFIAAFEAKLKAKKESKETKKKAEAKPATPVEKEKPKEEAKKAPADKTEEKVVAKEQPKAPAEKTKKEEKK